MATYNPSSGRQYVTLTSWAGDAGFSTTPLVGDQIEGPSTLTIGVDGAVTGTDGTYTLRHIQAANGNVQAISYAISAGGGLPAGTVTIGAVTKTDTTASIPFTYNDTDQTGFEYSIDGGAWAAVAASPISLTGLTQNTTYTVNVRAVNASGAGSAAQAQFTTSVTPTEATVDAPYAPPAGYSYVTLTSYSGPITFTNTPVAGDQIVYNDSVTVAANGTISGTSGTYTFYHVRGSTGFIQAVSYAFTAPNIAPVFTPTADRYGVVGDAESFTVVATDADVGDTLTYSADFLPGGLSLNASTGAVTGTYSTAHTVQTTFSVSDGEASATDVVVMTVAAASRVVVPLTVNYANLHPDSPLITAITDSDLEVGDQIDHPAVVNGRSVNFTSDGVLIVGGEGSITVPNIYIRDKSNITDGVYASIGPFSVTLTVDTSTPVITQHPQNQSVIAGSTVTLTAAAANAVSWQWYRNGTPIAGATGTQFVFVAGTVNNGDTYYAIATGTGGTAQTNTATLTVTVINQPPQKSGDYTQQTATVGVAFTFNAAQNFTDTDTLTFSVTGIPANSINANTGVITWTPTSGNLGNNTATVTATDTIGQSVSATLPINVLSDAPDLLANVGEPLVAFDLNSMVGTPGTYTFAADTLPGGISLDSATGIVSGTFSAAGYFTTIFTATQNGTTTTLDPYIWDINAPPVFTGSIPTLTGTVGQAALINYSGNFSEPDGAALFFTASNLPPGLAINNFTGVITGTPTVQGSYNSTITASDGRGSVSSNLFSFAISGSDDGVIDTPANRILTVYDGQVRQVSPSAIVKDMVEKIDVAVEWERILRPGETILTTEFTLDSSAILASGSVTSGTKTRCWFEGGALGSNYKVENTINTSSGATYNCSFYIVCVDL